jgi:hypothetical protein
MNTQNVVEYLFELALKQDVDTRDTLAEMDQVFNKAISTARAEAAKRAADRTTQAMLDMGLEDCEISEVVQAILADKNKCYHNTLFGYPVVIDNTIPQSRLIIMTPAVFYDLKKRLEPMMPYSNKQEEI